MNFQNNESELLHRLNSISSDGSLDAENADRRENLHRLFMYPAMMVPAAQSAIIKEFSDFFSRKIMAIDPFMGSGTALLSCMEYGFDTFGQDINPFAVILSKAKTEIYDIDELYASFDRLRKHIDDDCLETVDIYFNNIDKWFNEEAQVSFSKIRRAIISEPCKKTRLFYWVLMSETIRTGCNDRTSTFKLHQRSAKELENRKVDVIRNFFETVEKGLLDYQYFIDKLKDNKTIHGYGNAEIKWGNTQQAVNTKHKYNLLVSSPPYGDNHTTVTYGQTSYLPLQWIDHKDFDCPYEYLRTTQEIDRQSLGGKMNSKILAQRLDILFKKTSHLKSFYGNIPELDRPKYQKTLNFILDFDDSLDKIVDVMERDAYYIWTIGNRFVGGREVPNAEILQDLMESRNFNLFFKADRQIHNKKQACRNNFSKTIEKEKILIFNRRGE